jgi:hypothetical protein
MTKFKSIYDWLVSQHRSQHLKAFLRKAGPDSESFPGLPGRPLSLTAASAILIARALPKNLKISVERRKVPHEA